MCSADRWLLSSPDTFQTILSFQLRLGWSSIAGNSILEVLNININTVRLKWPPPLCTYCTLLHAIIFDAERLDKKEPLAGIAKGTSTLILCACVHIISWLGWAAVLQQSDVANTAVKWTCGWQLQGDEQSSMLHLRTHRSGSKPTLCNRPLV